MKTTKSYLAGLGMTGIVIASILGLLVIGTGLVAFDGQPQPRGSNRPLERVVVDDAALEPERGAARRRARRAAALAAAAERARTASRALALRATPEVAGGPPARRPASRTRARPGHGGAQVARAFALGGGARAGEAGAGTHRGRSGPRGRSPVGEPAPRRGDRSGGGAAAPKAAKRSAPHRGCTCARPPGAPRRAERTDGGRREPEEGASARGRTRRPAR
jgi:hypothetical protein